VNLSANGRRKRGLAIYKKMGWGRNADLREVDDDLWALTTDFVFGEIWSRSRLSLRERELIVLAVLVTLGTEGMDIHLRYAHKLGITDKDLKELILQVMYYAGQPKGLFAMSANHLVGCQENRPNSRMVFSSRRISRCHLYEACCGF
jgi:4-carboxymuconolactone decarboxylase